MIYKIYDFIKSLFLRHIDKMVFVIKAIKDDDLHRELYDPLYDPKKCNGSITVSKASLKNR